MKRVSWKKGALGPGSNAGCGHGRKAKVWYDAELKDSLAAERPFGDWVGSISNLEDVTASVKEKALFQGA